MGFGIEGEITKIYNTYVQKHPECSVLSPDAVYLRMKEEGVITQEQYNSIKKGLIFDFKSQKSETDGDWKSAFGLQTKQLTKTNSVKQNNIEQKTYHPVYKDLLLDSKGKIDMYQFSVETIKQKFPKNKYNIQITNFDKYDNVKSIIEITDKKGNKIYDLSYDWDGNAYQTSYKNGKEYNFYCIKNGIVISGKHTEPNGDFVQYDYDNDGKTLKEQIINNKDKFIKKTYENGKLVETDEKNQIKRILKKYSNGVVIFTTTQNNNDIWNLKEFNNLDYMVNNIFQRNNYGFLCINPNNTQKLIKVLDKGNIKKFLSEFREKHNSTCFSVYLQRGYDTKNKDKEKLLKHIEKCLMESTVYNPNKKVTNDRIKNENYTSNNIYDVQYNGNSVIINNKTTGRKSTLDFDKLLANIKNPEEKISHMENMQNLPAEILEFYANEGITLRGQRELDTYNKTQRSNAGGVYMYSNETITLPYDTDAHTYIHEIMHAVDFNKNGINKSAKDKLKNAYELGLNRYKIAKTTNTININLEDTYFAFNAKECWSRVGEMLFNGECANQEILKQFWPEFIELEKQAIVEIQSKPANERHS